MLPADWWIRWRDRDPVEDKLARAHVKHWVSGVNEALRKNKELGREPSTWEGLADAIYRDWANFSRRKAGAYARLSPQEFLAMASTVGLPTGALFPDTNGGSVPFLKGFLQELWVRVRVASCHASGCERVNAVVIMRRGNPYFFRCRKQKPNGTGPSSNRFGRYDRLIEKSTRNFCRRGRMYASPIIILVRVASALRRYQRHDCPAHAFSA